MSQVSHHCHMTACMQSSLSLWDFCLHWQCLCYQFMRMPEEGARLSCCMCCHGSSVCSSQYIWASSTEMGQQMCCKKLCREATPMSPGSLGHHRTHRPSVSAQTIGAAVPLLIYKWTAVHYTVVPLLCNRPFCQVNWSHGHISGVVSHQGDINTKRSWNLVPDFAWQSHNRGNCSTELSCNRGMTVLVFVTNAQLTWMEKIIDNRKLEWSEFLDNTLSQ